jgi:hypothetical protein
MEPKQIAADMVGYPIMELDVVYDGERPWRVQRANPDGTLYAVDAHAWDIVAGPLNPAQVVRVRSERIDDYDYMQSVWKQCQIMKEFIEDSETKSQNPNSKPQSTSDGASIND